MRFQISCAITIASVIYANAVESDSLVADMQYSLFDLGSEVVDPTASWAFYSDRLT